MASNGAPIPEHPSLDVATALAPAAPAAPADLNAPYTPLAGLQGAAGVTPGALPLLVRMPDGERRQIELPPTATVRDLRDALPSGANSNWDFNFNGQQLADGTTLASYNIPDAYGHAGGLLKMITDSGNLDTNQKAELLKNACNVVQHISRGETDMERLISAALDDTAPENNPPGSPTQPSLRAIRRGKRSFLSLNFANLPPPGPTVERAGAGPVAPPTPSQLIQKLSASRPDLYPPTTASRMLIENPPTPGTTALDSSFPTTTAGLPLTSPPPPPGGPTNGEFKRVNTNTWFSEFAKNIAPLEGDANGPHESAHEHHAIGDSEDEEPDPAPADPHKKEHNSVAAPSADGTKQGPTDGTASNATDSYLRSDPDEESSAPRADVSDGTSSAATPPGAKPGAGTGEAGGRSESESQAAPTAANAGNAANQATNAAANAAPLPKKRGRKRKNPELSEEERKALRQAQNRASAKQSRLRRKEMAKEYQQRVNTLEGENEHLRDTVAALSDRLQFLQNLLTVSVQKRPPGPPM